MNPDFSLKKLSPHAPLIAAVLAAALAGLCVYLIVWPQALGIADLVGRIGKKGAELKAAKKDISGIPRLKEEIASQQAKVEFYEKSLPAEKDIPKLLESLSGMARKANVSIVGITPAQASAKGLEDSTRSQIYQEVPILISAKCGYHELGSFLAGLESDNNFMKISDIKIRVNKMSPTKHDVELLISTYVLLEGK